MVIFDYKPNGYGLDEYFLYSGDLASLKKLSSHGGAPVNGWLVTSHGLWFRRLRFVVFGKENEIFLHSVDGIFNCSREHTKIICRRLLSIAFIEIRVEGALRARYAIRTPIRRSFENDGMFPSEAEPLFDVLTRISDPKEHRRLAKALSVGVALPFSVDS